MCKVLLKKSQKSEFFFEISIKFFFFACFFSVEFFLKFHTQFGFCI